MSLECYIRQIQGWGQQIFDHSISHLTPTVRRGLVNRIICYPSCFNPPHLGPKALLQHVFDDGEIDMNIIAAIIFPLDDEALEHKYRLHGGEILLTKAERVRLWRGHGRPDPCWVYDGSADSWKMFQGQLIHDISRDGFALEICFLCGLDHTRKLELYPEPWGFKDIILVTSAENGSCVTQ